jgi:hypothetical protein
MRASEGDMGGKSRSRANAKPATRLGGHSGARGIATVATAAVAIQAAAWGLLYWLTGVLRLGYGFFDLSDIRSPYFDYATLMARGAVPFRDFPIEYPPLFPPLLAVAGYTPDMETFVARFAFEMVLFAIAAGAVTALAAQEGHGLRRPVAVAAAFAVGVLALGAITANRYDAAVALLIALALLFMVRGRWLAVGVTLGLGFALKITPVVLVPLIVLLAPRERIAPALAVFAGSAAAPFLAVLGLGGNAMLGLTMLGTYHLDRPLEIESVPAAFFWLQSLVGGERIRVALAAGSQVIDSASANTVAKVFAVFVALALAGVFALVWRRREAIRLAPRHMVLAVAATMVASLVGSKVLSPQYFVWLLPVVALVALDRPWLGGLLLAAMALTQVLFPANYLLFMNDQAPWIVGVVIVRNILLVAAFALSLIYLWRIPAAKPALARKKSARA